MTIIIAGTVHLSAEKRDKTLADTAELVADTRTQPGCLHYVWTADPTSATRIYVYEKWADQDTLAAHLAGSFYQNMLGAMGAAGVTDVDVAKYKIALEEPVYDPEGKPRADFFTA